MPVNGFRFKRKGGYTGKSVISFKLKRDGDASYGMLSFLKLCFQEKLLKICYKYLYSEPTQVVKERILR